MSVTITITDPTEEEARRVADYLMELGGFGRHAPMDTLLSDAGFEVSGAPVMSPGAPVISPGAPVMSPGVPVWGDPEGPRTLASGDSAFASTPVVPVVPTVIVVPVEAPATAPAPHGVELDSAGLPWDGRIHSDTKSKIGDGTWRTRRGADPAIVATVTAELKAAMGAPVAPVAPSVPAASSVPVPPPFVASAAPSVPPVPTIPATGSAGAAPTVSPSDTVVPPAPPVSIAITTFPQLMMAITKGIGKGTFTQPDVVKAIEGVGLASIPMLASRPDLIPAVAAALGV